MIALVETGNIGTVKGSRATDAKGGPIDSGDSAKRERGVALVAKAIGVNANFAPTHNNLAYGLATLAVFEEALASY